MFLNGRKFLRKKRKKFRDEFPKYCSWNQRMTNLWREEFGLNKDFRMEPDKLDWTTLMHHGPKQTILRNIFFQWLFISIISLAN